MTDLAKYIDQTALRPFFNKKEFAVFIEDAKKNNYASVCIPPYLVPDATKALIGTGVKVCTVIGFPLGYSDLQTKIAESLAAISNGASEIDVVINMSAFKSGMYDYVADELTQLSTLAHNEGTIIKVIIETAYLTDEEIREICRICADAKVDFVKTSTGFAPEGAKIETVKLMRNVLPADIRIKASGGITTKEQALEFIAAGATRIGTSSGNKIIQ
jgi:deoxyribose-phosphate aldolase